MSEEVPSHSREHDIQKAIAEARDQIERVMDSADSEQLPILRLMLRIVGILNSEYGALYRMTERMDQAVLERHEMNEKLFGKTPGDDDCLASKVNQSYSAVKSVRRLGMAIAVAVAVGVVTRWYDTVKLNEILASQKVQTTIQQNKP